MKESNLHSNFTLQTNGGCLFSGYLIIFVGLKENPWVLRVNTDTHRLPNLRFSSAQRLHEHDFSPAVRVELEVDVSPLLFSRDPYIIQFWGGGYPINHTHTQNRPKQEKQLLSFALFIWWCPFIVWWKKQHVSNGCKMEMF